MRSTEGPASLLVGFRRADVTAFWLLASGLVAMLGTGAAYALGLLVPAAWGVGCAAVALLPGLVWRPWFETGVWFWNGSVGRCVAILRRYVLAVTYYLLFVPLGLATGARRSPAAAGTTAWVPRHPSGPATSPAADATCGGSSQGLQAFVVTPGHRWSWCLVPIVRLLRRLGQDEQQAVPSGSTYTLY